jgi:hypothetical protein
MSVTDIGKKAAEESNSGQSVDPDDHERYDVSNCEYLKVHPTVAIGGTATVLRRFPGDPADDEDRGFAGLIVTDPFIMTGDEDKKLDGSTIFSSTKETGDDFKVVNLDDEATDEVENAGVDFDGNLFYGEKVDDFDGVDELVIKMTGNAGRSAVQCLDVKGRGAADVERTESGEPVINENSGFPTPNGRLVEYFDDTNGYTPPRYARDTQLRPDVEGKKVVFLLQRLKDVDHEYDGDAYWSTVMAKTDNGLEAIQPTEEFEPDPTLQRATGWLDEAYPSDDEIQSARDAQGVSVSDN